MTREYVPYDPCNIFIEWPDETAVEAARGTITTESEERGMGAQPPIENYNLDDPVQHPDDPRRFEPGEIVAMDDPRLNAVSKPSNPKDAMGIKKVPMSCVSAPVIAEIGLGMMEGAMKYGRHNYRVIGVRASVYYDAVMRHMMAYWEGEDIDPDSGLPHVSKAMASLAVLRDAQMRGNCTDDRPPRATGQWMQELNAKAAALVDKYPAPVAPFTHVDQSWADAADGPGYSPVTDKQRRRMAELRSWRLGDAVRARAWPDIPEEAVGLPRDVERHE